MTDRNMNTPQRGKQMRTHTIHHRLAFAALLAGTALVAAPALADPVNPKPVNVRESCTATPVYELAALTAPTTYRATTASVPSGYDPGGTPPTCGPVTRAQPLTCIDDRGVPTQNAEACAGEPSRLYALKSQSTVYRGAGSLNYYTTQASRIGTEAGPLATSVRLKHVSGDCLQVAELEAFAGNVNVALASNGGVAASSQPYDSSSHAGRVNDGTRPADYPAIFHSQCRGGDYVQVTFAKASKISSISAWGRAGGYGFRDNYTYELLNGSTVVASGNLNPNANGKGTATVSTATSCDAPVSYEWRSVTPTVAGVCGTRRVDNEISCVVSGTSEPVDSSLCNAAQRPPAQSEITSTDGCAFQYDATAWSVGPEACGDVVQTRTVTCRDTSGNAVADGSCANHLTPPSDRNPASIPDAEYWSKGPYAWEGAPGGSVRIWRMPDFCAGEPDAVRRQCEIRYLGKAGVNQPYLRPRETQTVADKRACTTPAPVQGTWNQPTYTPDRQNVCGPNTRSARVFCMDSSGAEIPDARCDPSTRPPSSQNFEDTSGCTSAQKTSVTPSITEIQMGWCRYTSSGGGRHSCGEGGIDYAVRTAGAPNPSDLCTGQIVAGAIDGPGPEEYQTPRAGAGWTKPPVTKQVPGAQCVIHWKWGYSDSATNAGWSSAYYSGPATGRQGGTFIARKP